MSPDLEQKLKTLKEVYATPQDQRAIDNAERMIRKNIAQAKLADVAPVQEVIDDSVKKVQEISTLLSWDMSLTAEERGNMDRERAVHLFWLKRFSPKGAERALEMIEQTLNAKIEEAGV